jgi:predicted small lipoprotein YifL
MRSPALLIAALLLTGCGVEQTQPAATPDADRWGHLPPDPERQQQVDAQSDATAA